MVTPEPLAVDRLLTALVDLDLSCPRHLPRGAVLPGAHLDLTAFGPDIARALPALDPALRGLWLADNALGPEHAPALAALLARLPRLEHLDLSDNPLGPAGVAVLAPALAGHRGLRSLALADVGLDAAGLCLLGHVLSDTSVLHLRLAATRGPAPRLAAAATRDPAPRPAARASDPSAALTGRAATEWAALLRRDPPWRSLALPGARLDPHARAQLLAALAGNTRLCHLDLGVELPPAALARLCSNANRLRVRPIAPDRARLRRGLPAASEPPRPLAPEWGLADAELDVCLRVLAALSLRTDRLRTDDHPRIAAVRRAVADLGRDERRADRRLARPPRERRDRQRHDDRERIAEAGIRTRTGGVAEPAPAPATATIHELHTPRPCYVCKTPYTRLHFFYDRLCPDCAAYNYARRGERVDLRGRLALVTGGRVKIGHHTALRLLDWGARVIVTSRFARDTARRFAAHPDFASFQDRLHIYPLDLRAIPHVEAFAAHVAAAYPRLDILINNAAQTIHRPPEYYAALLADEALGLDALPGPLRPLLPALPAAIAAIPAEHALFPQDSDDGFGRPLDLRSSNSWRLRLDEVGTVEMLEVQLINNVAPFVLNARLRRALAGPRDAAFIVNVSAPEGRFDRDYKAPFHPHTNMAKAALNMMTRTAAEDYARDAIYMTSVDTGWASNENPAPIAAAMLANGFSPPLDLVDAAARVCDPIVRGLRDGLHLRGVFLKDYRPITW